MNEYLDSPVVTVGEAVARLAGSKARKCSVARHIPCDHDLAVVTKKRARDIPTRFTEKHDLATSSSPFADTTLPNDNAVRAIDAGTGFL